MAGYYWKRRSEISSCRTSPTKAEGPIKRSAKARCPAGHFHAGMMNQPAAMNGPPIMKRLIEGIEHKARMGRSACPLTDDTAGKGINDERDVNEALPGRDIGETG